MDPQNISGSSGVASSRERRFDCLVQQRYCAATSSRKKPQFFMEPLKQSCNKESSASRSPASKSHTLTVICRKSGQCTSILIHTTYMVLQSPCYTETVPPAIYQPSLWLMKFHLTISSSSDQFSPLFSPPIQPQLQVWSITLIYLLYAWLDFDFLLLFI